MTAPMHQPVRTLDLYRWAPGVVFSESYRAGWVISRHGATVSAKVERHPYSGEAEDAAKAANVWLALIFAGRRRQA
jgi:hypothetical protein